MTDYQNYRREYKAGGLSRTMLAADPWQQFAQWMRAAEDACSKDATSMTLATASSTGMPSARIVLLKGYSQEGLVWFTDQRSEKGQQLAQNPQAAVLFYWPPLERQVRVCGDVEVLDQGVAEAYFASRPQASQLSAAASEQSQVVVSREVLEASVAVMRTQANAGEDDRVTIPKPESWLGYRLRAKTFEFWQGQPSRLHDRFRYRQDVNGDWLIDRLSP